MEEMLNEMMEWGTSTIDLLQEAGLTPEEITETLADE